MRFMSSCLLLYSYFSLLLSLWHASAWSKILIWGWVSWPTIEYNQYLSGYGHNRSWHIKWLNGCGFSDRPYFVICHMPTFNLQLRLLYTLIVSPRTIVVHKLLGLFSWFFQLSVIIILHTHIYIYTYMYIHNLLFKTFAFLSKAGL